MSTHLIEKAVEIVGSQAELARQMKVAPSFIVKMLRTGRVPAERCRQIEHLTGGLVTAEQIRPDIYGPYQGPINEAKTDQAPNQTGSKI